MTKGNPISLTDFFYRLIYEEKLLDLSAQNKEKLHQPIQHYPACDRLAFEIDLGEINTPVDFHINLKTLFFRQKFLAELQAKENLDKEKWKPLIELLQLWNNKKSQLFKLVPGVFLEFDFNKENQLPLPSFFAKLDAENCSKEEILSLSRTIIKTLKGQQFYTDVESFLNHCIYKTPENAYLGYIGIMLSRKERVLRLNIYNLTQHSVIPFLQELGWKGDAKNVLMWFTQLMQFCDNIIVSFDVFNGMVLPKIGLEAFIDRQPAKDYRWNSLINYLHNKNLCVAEKKDALFNWNKEWLPITTPWHSDLKIASLYHPFNEMVYIKQLLSHVKITVHENQNINAKIYAGIGQTFRVKEDKTDFIINNNVTKAISSGLTFLKSKQNQLGLWLDYYLPAGYSDEWVTGYIATILKYFFDNDLTKHIIENAHSALQNRWIENKGLAYNNTVPSDSDSSSWFLHLNYLLKKENNKIGVLDLFRNHDNGLGTYIKNDSAIKEYTKQLNDADFSGWEKSHDCVSATAACFDEKSLSYILEKINSNISLQSYWWKNDFYTYFWAYFAILKNKKKYSVYKNYFNEQLNTDTTTFSSFDKAYYIALCALLKIKNTVSEQFYIDLLKSQRAKGYWQSSALLLVPMPSNNAKNISQKQWEMYDVNHTFTTITILMGLELYRQI